jgi:hypothetical protein
MALHLGGTRCKDSHSGWDNTEEAQRILTYRSELVDHVARNVYHIPRPHLDFLVSQPDRGPSVQDKHAMIVGVLVQACIPSRVNPEIAQTIVECSIVGANQYPLGSAYNIVRIVGGDRDPLPVE